MKQKTLNLDEFLWSSGSQYTWRGLLLSFSSFKSIFNSQTLVIFKSVDVTAVCWLNLSVILACKDGALFLAVSINHALAMQFC